MFENRPLYIYSLSTLAALRVERPNRSDETYIEIGDIDAVSKTVVLKDKPPVPGSQLALTGDVLISTVRPGRGAVARSPCRAAVSPALSVLYGASEADTAYVFHTACRPEFASHLDREATGSTYPTCSDQDVLGYGVFVPRPAERERVVAVLDTLNQVIWKTEALIAKCQRIKTGLMQDLLTRGIDEHGDIRSGEKYTLKDSPFGRIPAEWEVVTANDACSVITKGTTPKKRGSESPEYPIPFLRVQNLTFGGVVAFAHDREFISVETHKHELARSIVRGGDVLTNIVGPPLGKVAIVPNDYPEWNVNQAIAIFRPTDRVLCNFLCHWLQAPKVRNWFEVNSKKTSGQQNLTLQHCQELPLLLPSIEEQRRIETLIQEIETLISLEHAYLRKLVLQKKGLMQDLLTGKVSVEPLLETQTAR